MNIVIVELQGEIIASESPITLSADDLNVRHPRGTIYVTQNKGESWYVINRGSPVVNTRFNSRAKIFDFPNQYLPEIVRLAAMLA